MTRTGNKIKTRAAAFMYDWQDAAPPALEAAEEQTRETGFHSIFGVDRSQCMSFEQALSFTNIRNPIELPKWCCD